MVNFILTDAEIFLLYYLKLYNIVDKREIYNRNVRRREQMQRTRHMQRASISTTTH